MIKGLQSPMGYLNVCNGDVYIPVNETGFPLL